MNPAWNLEPQLDRLAPVRADPGSLRALWREPGARLLVVDRSGRVARDAAGEPTLESGPDFDPQRHVLLGRVGRTAWFCARGEVVDGCSLRDSVFDSAACELVTAATAVLAWHDSAEHCPRCGASTRIVHGGFQRSCPSCGAEHFPRTDPAMIVAVLDAEDRLLLAHHSAWPEGRVSILAGFVEAGESAEHAVVREVREEAGIDVVEARFLASQPWPYPRSLMLGFVARGRGQIEVDGVEIEWAQWYTPRRLRDEVERGLTLPGTGSVAGRIIELWSRGGLPAPEGAIRV